MTWPWNPGNLALVERIPNRFRWSAIHIALWFCFALHSASGQVYFPTLNQAYSALGFDPRQPGNSVIVFFTDAHMNLDISGVPYPNVTTNLDWRLLKIINEMDPAPAKVLVGGDESSNMAALPGGDASYDPPTYKWATNEMAYFATGIKNVTNVSQTNILWIPGNHDQGAFETNAETFCKMFPGMPPYQTFEHNGIRFFLLNSGNYGDPSESERVWLKSEVAKLQPTKPVIVVVHHPPFHNIAAHRGMGVLLRDLFKDWQARWWVLAGHEHSAAVEVYNVGKSNVAMLTVGAANTNTFVGFRHDVGFSICCLNTNGIAGQIYYYYDLQCFQIVGQPDWDWPMRFVPAFESVQGLMWRRFKGPGLAPEQLQTNATDSVTWWAYPEALEWGIPLSDFGNKATHFLLLMAGRTTNTVLEASVDRLNWSVLDWPEPKDAVYAFPLSKQLLAARMGYWRLRSRPFYGNNWVGGWGLANTNGTSDLVHPGLLSIPDQQIVAGKTFRYKPQVVDPYSPPDVVEYSLVNGPGNAVVDPLTGEFRWRPSIVGSPVRVRVEIRVQDRGTPHTGSTQEFWLDVLKPSGPILSMVPDPEEEGSIMTVTADPGAYSIMASTNAASWSLLCVTNGPDIRFRLGGFPSDAPHGFFKVSHEAGKPVLNTPAAAAGEGPYVLELVTPESRFTVWGSDDMQNWQEILRTNIPGVNVQIIDPEATVSSPRSYSVQ